MENNKQTAVDWIWDKIVVEGNTNYTDLLLVAKKMERKQIEIAYKHGQNNGYIYREGLGNIIKPEQYFIENYGE